MDAELGSKPFFLGDTLSGADIALSFVVEVAEARDFLDGYDNLKRFAERIHARPAYQRAVQRGGPYQLPPIATKN
jgi:glutathione S-transferase